MHIFQKKKKLDNSSAMYMQLSAAIFSTSREIAVSMGSKATTTSLEKVLFELEFFYLNFIDRRLFKIAKEEERKKIMHKLAYITLTATVDTLFKSSDEKAKQSIIKDTMYNFACAQLEYAKYEVELDLQGALTDRNSCSGVLISHVGEILGVSDKDPKFVLPLLAGIGKGYELISIDSLATMVEK